MIQFNSSLSTNSATLESCKKSLEKVLQDPRLGFTQMPELDQKKWMSRVPFIQKHQNIFFVGLGGSSLGGKALVKALTANYTVSSPQVTFIDNISPELVARQMPQPNQLANSHWVFQSKSGTTSETLALLSYINSHYSKNGLKLSDFSTCFTENSESPIGVWAKSNAVECFSYPPDIEGRFSVLSGVGLLPIEVLGFRSSEVLSAAKSMLSNTDLVCSIASYQLECIKLNKSIHGFWFYSDSLLESGQWLQQLWAESLAKKEARSSISTPMLCRGTSDQHSLLQQMADGAQDKAYTFLTVKTPSSDSILDSSFLPRKEAFDGYQLSSLLNSQAEATRTSLEKLGAPCSHLELQIVNEESLGQLLMLWQLVVAVIGEEIGADIYTQPGVESSKQLLRQLLSK